MQQGEDQPVVRQHFVLLSYLWGKFREIEGPYDFELQKVNITFP